MSNFREEVQDEAEIALLSKERCTGDISVRLGKTKIMLNIATKFEKVIVSYPNKPIYESWIKDAEKFKINISNITFTTNMSLHKHNLKEYDCLICDECDTLSINNLTHIVSNMPKNVKFLTGTIPVKGSDKRWYMDKYIPIVYTKKLEDTVGHTSKDYNITIHVLDANKTILTKADKSTWTEQKKIKWLEFKYKASNSWSDMLLLMNVIKNSKTKVDYLSKLVKENNDKCIIFVETKSQCEDLKIPSYYSGNKDSEKNFEMFQKDEIKELATINQLKASITFNNLNKCIILHTYASASKAHQKIARCLTLSTTDKADIHILCLKDTFDENWIRKGLAQFKTEKIKWKII